ncbi:MAG TPA: DedA family protein [Ktedonobacterales bacterium]
MGQIYAWGASLPPLPLYLFIIAWLFIETVGFPISDEPLLLLAGYLTTLHRLEMALVIGMALAGKVAASCVAYWLGRRVNLERLARPGERPRTAMEALRPSLAAMRAIEERFRRQSAWAVFAGRLIPVVRSFISYPAGAARMPFLLFLTATTAGSLLWIAFWTIAGAVAGRSYTAVAARWGRWSWLTLALAALVALALWLWRSRRRVRA